MRGIVDPFYSRVYFAVDEAGLGDYDTFYVYDWNLTRWTKTEASIVLHIPAATPGQTLESLADISASLDALPFSLDSRVWQGVRRFWQHSTVTTGSGSSRAAMHALSSPRRKWATQAGRSQP